MSLLTLPSDLVSVTWLAKNCQQSSLVLLDASYFMAHLKRDGKKEWAEKTIPGALFFDFDKTVCDPNSELPHMMPDAPLFQKSAQALGINQDSAIVVFDRLGIFSSPRVWWMFKSMGFNNVAVLDGGLNSWIDAGLTVASGIERTETIKGDFIADYQATSFSDKQAVLNATEETQTCIVDARANNRFLGEVAEPRADLRSGHMPNAKNLPFSSLIENGRMRSVEQLTTLYGTHMVNHQQNAIFSCGSGVTACVLALGATLCGYKNLSVYDGSWTEWGADSQLPVVK